MLQMSVFSTNTFAIKSENNHPTKLSDFEQFWNDAVASNSNVSCEHSLHNTIKLAGKFPRSIFTCGR